MKAERSWEDNVESWNAGTDIWEAKIHWKNANWLKKKNKKNKVYNILRKQRNAFKMTFLISLDNLRSSKLPTQQINGTSKENQSLLVNKVEISFFPKGPQSQP